MTAPPTPKTTLESIVTRFRRESLASPVPPELEIRFPGLDRAVFAEVFAGLVGRGLAPKFSQMVGAIVDQKRVRNALTTARIREIHFELGERHHETYVQKTPLVLPFRVPANSAGLSYIVTLSSELADNGQGFTIDDGGIIRVKTRASFALQMPRGEEPPFEWRVDLTVARKIMGSDARTALKSIIGRMFNRAPTTAENYLRHLGINAEEIGAPEGDLYSYELECEFLGPAELRDALRPADIAAAAAELLNLANPGHLQEVAGQDAIYRAAHYIITAAGYRARFEKELGLKRLLPAALAITRADYREIYPPKGLFLTDKADGKRALAVVRDGRCQFVSDAYHEYAAPPGLAPADRALLAADTILDGELVTREGAVTFFAFDVIALGGIDYAREPFEKRLDVLRRACEIAALTGAPVQPKPYIHITGDTPEDLEKVIRKVHEAKRPYTTDGLIFVAPGRPYLDTMNYKWKSAEDNTIDFYVRRAPAAVLGRAPFVERAGHKLHFLFVGVSLEMHGALGLQWCPGYAELFGERGHADIYAPVQFAPSDVPLAYLYYHPDSAAPVDGQIAEMRCIGGCLAAGGGSALVDWEVVRIREDRRRELLSKRYFGNDLYSAELIWLNNVDPFPIEQLWAGPGSDYFVRAKSGAYLAQTAAISFVKAQLISALEHAALVVDLGSGKGQDLGRYLDAAVQSVLFIDQDRAALSELVRRKFSFAKQKGGKRRTAVHTLAADLSAPAAATLARMEGVGFARASADAVVCNLAVHYFLASPQSLANFVALTKSIVKPGGRVTLTALLGEEVHALFLRHKVPEGGTWDAVENGVVKFSLRRLYGSDRLEAAGQRVGVLLPFSNGEYYEEYLVNTAAVAREYTNHQFSVVDQGSMRSYLTDFEDRNRKVASQLTPHDRTWVSLYGYMIFQKSSK